jgi:hypothetical protein
MKNFKKVIALVLALVMVLSLSVPAFAATTNEAKADVLYDLGLFKGYSTTEKQLGLEDAANAYQAIVLIGRALGWATDAEATVDFTDVPDYAVPFVAYAVAEGITNGVSATEFGAAVDGKRMVTWTLRALGYDMTEAWEDTDTLAATAGITVPTGDVIRDTVAGVIYETLMTTPVGGTTTVIADLVAADATLEAVAVAAGLVEATPDALAVEGVAMTNLKEVVVTFNMPLAKDKDVVGNFAVTGNTVSAIAADGAAYTLTLENAEPAQSDVEVIAKTGTGLAAEYKTTLTSVKDFTVPTLVSVELTGPKTFDLTFSEPINVKPTVLVNNGVYGASVAAPSGNKVTVTLSSTLTDGDYALTVKDATDFANWKMASTADTLVYVKDTAALTVSVVEAKQTYVTVEFNKVPDAATLAKENFYHTYSAWAATTVSAVSGSTTQFKVEFPATHYVVPGTTNFVVLAKANSKDLADQWGNKLSADVVLPISVTIDQDAPTVASVTVKAENKVEVVFSEDVLGATTADNYVITDKDAKVVGGTITATYVAADKKATVNFDKLAGGNYTLTIKNITDNTPQANKITEVGTPIVITDMTAPVVVKAEFIAADKVVYVSFNEAMGAQALVLANWSYTDAGESATPTKAEYFNGDTKKIKLTFDKNAADAAVTLVDGGANLYFGKIDDAAGNVVAPLSTDVTTFAAVADATFTAKLIAENKVEVTFSGKVVEGQAVAANYFINNPATTSGSAAVVDTFSEDKDGNTVVTLVTPSTVTFASNVANATVSVSGVKLDTGAGAAAGNVTASDKIAPTISTLTTVAGVTMSALVTFDENIAVTGGEALAALDLVVINDGTALAAGTDYTTTVAGAVLKINLVKGVAAGKELSVATVAAPAYITDAGGTKANAMTTAKKVKY